MRACITTSQRATPERRAHARDRSLLWQMTFVDRDEMSLPKLVGNFDAVLVFEEEKVRLVDADNDVVFHPGMAYRRIERLGAGAGDALVDIGRIEPGHRVLDGTLGLAQDALVAAAAVGNDGRVVGVDASRLLAAFAEEGLPTCRLPRECDVDIAKIIEVHHGTVEDWLSKGTETFDVALLDPMFKRPKQAHHSFGILRKHARSMPISDTLIAAVLTRADTVVVRLGDIEALKALQHQPARVRRTQSTIWAAFEGA